MNIIIADCLETILVGGYHVKVGKWSGKERQSTVENVRVEWPTAVQVEENAIVMPMITHDENTVDIWQTRTQFLLLSWDLELIPVDQKKDIIRKENCNAGVRMKKLKCDHYVARYIYFRTYLKWLALKIWMLKSNFKLVCRKFIRYFYCCLKFQEISLRISPSERLANSYFSNYKNIFS